MTTLDIVVLTYRRAPLLRRCLESLEGAAAEAGVRLRTIVVVNGPDPATSAELRGHRFPALDVEVVELPERLPCGFARNAGIERTSADWIYFADDDAWVDREFFRAFFDFDSSHPSVAVVGGPNVTAASMTSFQKKVGDVLASRLAAGPFSKRYREGGDVESVGDDRALILCNLFVRRAALADYRFPSDLSCAEENHMLHELDRRLPEERKVFHPRLAVFHERPREFSRFASSILRYGRGRGELISLDGWGPRSSRLVIVGLVIAIAIAASIPSKLLVWSYTSGLAVFALWNSVRRRDVSALFWVPILTLSLHVLYPTGVAIGILQTPLQSFRAMSAPILALAEARSSRRPRRHDRP